MSVEFFQNILTADDYLYIHKEMQYQLEPKEQIEQALKKGIFSVVVKDGEKIIGMGRMVGDGYMYCYIQDVRVLPQYQKKGIGKAIINKLLDYARQNGIPNTSISIGLTSAKGKENFYEKFGFVKLPDVHMGSGMYRDIDIE